LHLRDFRKTYGRWLPVFQPRAITFFPVPDLTRRQIEEFRQAAKVLEGLLTKRVAYRDNPDKTFPVKCSRETLDQVGRWIAEADRLLVSDRGNPIVDSDPVPTRKPVAAGDTVWSAWLSSSWTSFPAYLDAFQRLNPDVDPNLIYAGRSYNFPAPPSES
jgi:hypothetical protein